MIIGNNQSVKKKQGGLILLALMIVLVLAFTAYYFSSISITELKVEEAKKTSAVLQKAKQALLDYATTNWRLDGQTGKVGRLPCPDVHDTVIEEGEQDGSCGSETANAVGYFPWGTLDLAVTKDSSDSCLIYAVSPGYKTNPASSLNPDTYGQFELVDKDGNTLQGLTPETRPVAVIFAPGPALPAQARAVDDPPPPPVCGSYYGNNELNLIAAYLDNNGTTNNAALDPGTENTIEKIVSGYPGSDDEDKPNRMNDRLVTITYEEFWDAMKSTVSESDASGAAFNNEMKNLTEDLALCFANYGSNNSYHLPMPAEMNLNGGDYRKNSGYNDSFNKGYAGRLPYSIKNSNSKIGSASNNNIFDNPYCSEVNTDLWTNWKDHFFYAISIEHNPEAATVQSCHPPQPGPPQVPANCISINGNLYAGVVFYSGQKQPGQQRYAPPVDGGLAAPPDHDDKSDISNYLENGNNAGFPNDAGNATYFPVDPLNSNDIMFCIEPDMSGVVECL